MFARFSAKSLARQVRSRARKFESRDDSSLRELANELRFKARGGTPLRSLLVDAYALMHTMCTRKLFQTHYPVQILGGVYLSRPTVVEMETGEGKTLTATLPLFLYSLFGRGAHLATANDYLAARDAEFVRPAFVALGVSVGRSHHGNG